MLLLNFPESLNMVTNSQYAERVALHIKTAEVIQDDSRLTSLFIQVQVIRIKIVYNISDPICV